MKPRIVAVQPLASYRLDLVYETGERRVFDLTPWLDQGMFRALKDHAVFSSVRPFHDTIEWSTGADIDPETLYEDSVPAIQ